MSSESGSNTYLEHKEIVAILIGLASGLFLAALDQTIVATAIRTIGDDLNGLSLQAWVTTAYLITSTVTTPLYGKFSDIYGRKPLFLIAISLFIAGSLMSGFATSMFQLAAFRAFQGLGAGGLFTLALAVIGDIVPPRERARYQGFFLAVFGTSSVIGPVVGGFFAGATSILWIDGWRWVFLINVPIGFFSLFMVSRRLHIPNFERHNHRIDWAGVLFLNVALIPLLLVAERGREWGMTSSTSLSLMVLTVIGVIGFVVSEFKMGDEAILPLRLFKNRTFSLVAVGGLITGAGFFGALMLLPLYLQIVGGASPTRAGLELMPLTFGIMLGSVVAGQTISKIGRYKWFPVAGALIVGVATILMVNITVDTTYPLIAGMAALFGLGMGGLMQPLVLAVQNAVSPRDIGVGTSSVTLFRQLGGTLGVAVFLSVFFDSLPEKIGPRFQAAVGTAEYQQALADPANAATVAQLQSLQSGGAPSFDDTSWLSSANQTLVRPILEGFTDSQSLVFTISGVLVLLSTIFFVFMPDLEVKAREGAPVVAE